MTTVNNIPYDPDFDAPKTENLGPRISQDISSGDKGYEIKFSVNKQILFDFLIIIELVALIYFAFQLAAVNKKLNLADAIPPAVLNIL
ncbi:hypothetical protein HY224_01150 [Candidatus Uhrbacteria bacterium]|nr:hypothetical protein [Candidatus Uhrbacteria bacterium]